MLVNRVVDAPGFDVHGDGELPEQFDELVASPLACNRFTNTNADMADSLVTIVSS
jgi:hypothetical protein